MEHALGCIIGVLVGDASGATLEFKKRFDNNDVSDAMHMKGGGALNVGKGQVTDDGELTLALAHSLTVGDKYYPMSTVAKAYNSWMNSDPFDAGMTCGRAFSIQGGTGGDGFGGRLLYNAARYNMLSHPNQVCLECNAIYVVALASLINNSGDAGIAFRDVEHYIESSVNSEKVKAWFYKDRHAIPDARMNIGHVRHAFCMAMNFLENPVEYEVGIRHVLRLGGDTDTNAAICGGILGAINGYDGIPDYMKLPVLSYEYNQDDLMGYERPEMYHPKSILKWVGRHF